MSDKADFETTISALKNDLSPASLEIQK